MTTPPQTPADSLDRVVQSLDGKVVIPVDMATELMTKIAGLEGYQPADAAKLRRSAGSRPGGDGPDVPHHHHGR
ncbi:hypothetical protein LNP25_22515 [Klebsiella variicola subsp. variicola]|nr:hypothetical protein [Klebsiella variicola subsp. variicola]